MAASFEETIKRKEQKSESRRGFPLVGEGEGRGEGVVGVSGF
jgi:hypothetical protein